MADIEKCRKIYDFLITNPEKHNQSDWAQGIETYDPKVTAEECGTTACIAGWATIMDRNLKPVLKVWEADGFYKEMYEWNYIQPMEGWEESGRAALGLHWKTANVLFYCMNRDIVLAMLHDLAEGTPEEIVTERYYDGDYSSNAGQETRSA